VCQRPAARVHSRYERHIADLPWSGVRVTLHVLARRFRCLFNDCPRRIFCERLPSLVAACARRTHPLTALLQALGFALGGRPGVRLLSRLHLVASRMTLLRLVRAAPESPVPTPRVLGVDDWAFRRGRVYGTILVDLGQHRAVELLPEATVPVVVDWLQQHRGIEVLSRDRGGVYAEAGRRGAPEAVQVADRFHLLVRRVRRVVDSFCRKEGVRSSRPLSQRLTRG
jgi:transposase